MRISDWSSDVCSSDLIVVGPDLPDGFSYGSNVYDGPVNFTYTSRQRGEVDNYAVYLFDAMKLGKFELNGGVRYERSSGSRRTGLGVTIPADYSDNPFSYRIGLVYNTVDALPLYSAYGNSKTPYQYTVNVPWPCPTSE